MKWLLIAVWLASPLDGVDPRSTVLAEFPSQRACMAALAQLVAQRWKLPLLCVENPAAAGAVQVPL